MLFELWTELGEGDSFFPKDHNYHKAKKTLGPNAQLEWTCEATSLFDAMQQMYTYRGWGKYKPEPDWEDTHYDADDDKVANT